MLHAVDRLDDLFQRLGDELGGVGGLQARRADLDVDHRHRDLRLLLARQRDEGDDPERHAALLAAGASLAVETAAGTLDGRLAKIYPQIEGGRVTADVEVPGLSTDFVDARVLVRVPIGTRQAILLPAIAVSSRSGIDTLRVSSGGGETDRTVVLGERHGDDVEILSGLAAGDAVVLP